MNCQLVITAVKRINIPHKTFTRKVCSPPRKFTTTVVVKSSKPNHPVIISRQYLNELRQNSAHRGPLKSSNNKSGSDKPWPKNWRIFGYTVFCLSIPCSFATYTVEQNWIREYLLENTTYGKDAIAFLRNNFGHKILYHPELDSTSNSYIELKEERYFDHDNDLPSTQTSQDGINEHLEYPSYRVEVMLNDGLSFCTVLKGNILMNLESLKQAFQGSTYLDENERDIRIAIEFLDDEEYDNQEENSLTQFDEEVVGTNKTALGKSEVRTLSSSFSTWHHFPTANDDTTATSNILSDKEMEISKLQHREQELTTMLDDKNCTASVDELINELKDVQKALYKVKGKWIRWGWVSLFK